MGHGAGSALVTAAAGGDQAAWDELVERHAQEVWAAARSHALDADEAADATVLAWMRLADSLAEFSSDAEVGTWLCAVAHEEARAIVRRGTANAAAALSVALAG
jgi:DNA-directed RNA polymerase specialized sigma24 family protein